MNYDIDEMIKEAEAKKQDGESVLFGFGVGRIAPKLGYIRAQKKAMRFICSLDGFMGVHPVDLYRNILLFDTLNNAKGGRNLLRYKGVDTGDVIPVIVKDADIRR